MVTAAPMPPRLRFAPSPSGYLHIGGARTALFNWLWARQKGGSFVIRVEDTDQDRSSLDSVRAILDALRWLGLDWDEGPEAGGPHAPYFQSERRARYREIADRLVAEGQAYRCYATREELDRARAELKARDPKAQFVYPGWWRERSDWPEGKPYVIRFKTPHGGETHFDDRVFGRISTPHDQLQDFVLLRSDGYPLYNFSCVVDDHDMGITLVGRGRDHIGNTAPQVLIYRALGWDPPEFAHLPMMLAPNGEKLSKRHAAVSVQDYRDRGYTPMGVLNYLVRFGWSYGDREIFSRQELIQLFDWERVNRSDGKYDERKFLDTNFEHLKVEHLTSSDQYLEWVKPWLAARGIADPSEGLLRAALPLVRERARTLVEAAHALDYFFREPPELDPQARAKFLVPAASERLAAVERLLGASEEWRSDLLEARFRGYVQEQGHKMQEVAQPVRVAVTGRTASPPLFDVMAVLGRERTLARLAWAAGIARQG